MEQEETCIQRWLSLSLFVGPDIDEPAASGVVSPFSAPFMDRRRQAVGPTVLHQAEKKKTTVGPFLSLAHDRLAGGSSEREMTPKASKTAQTPTYTHGNAPLFSCVLVS